MRAETEQATTPEALMFWVQRMVAPTVNVTQPSSG